MPEDPRNSLLGAKLFVGTVYLLLAASFVATTGVMIWEFQDAGWLDHLTTHSHLFLFFPTFGIISLIAFFSPATVLTDLYWRRRKTDKIKASRTRFVGGGLALALLSVWIGQLLLGSPQRSAWEIAPSILLADQGVPAKCADMSSECERLPVLSAIAGLRAASQSRLGLTDLVRECTRDPLLDRPVIPERKRICLASSVWPRSSEPRYTTDAECCRAQQRLLETVNGWHTRPEQRSLTAAVHAWLLWCKVFFLLTLLAISVLLTWRHKLVVTHYGSWLGRVEIGLMVGMGAAVFMPLMSEAFVQSSGALSGTQGHGTFSLIAPALTIGFGAWTMLILLFFFRQRDRSVEIVIKLVGALGSIAFGLKYDAVVSVFVRFANSGADAVAFGILLVLWTLGILFMVTPWARRIAAVQGAMSADNEKRIEQGTSRVVQ